MAPRKSRGGGGGGVGAAGRRAAAGHRLPARLPPGLLLTDVSQRRWRLGRSIGCGGFGEIYAAARDAAPSAAAPAFAADAAFAVKVEPHSNGPLFSEMHCYHRVARAETIAAWQRARRLRRLGMPRFVGSGSVEYAGERYRFMVMERFGTDLQQLLNRHGGRFALSTVLAIGIQVLDTLEYIHSREYIHADIKAQNLLLGYKKGTENQVYLVDFGLACRFSLNGRHKPYRSDLRKAHDGTIEFTSRDAHIGAHSRRGDLEILGYNLLQWTAGRLPWLEVLHDADLVAAEKNRHMRYVPGLVRACFGDILPSGAEVLQQYMQAVAALGFDTEPDYDLLRAVLRTGLDCPSSCPRLRFAAAAPGGAAAAALALMVVSRGGGSSRAGRRRPRSRSGRRQQPAAKRARPAAASRASSGGGQENSLGRARSPPGRRGRAPLRLVTDNSVPPPPPPEPPELPRDKQTTSPSLRSDGKLRDFDWQHFNKVVEEVERRRGGVQRTSASDGGSGDTSPEPGHTVYDNITPAMRDVLAKRQQRSPEKGDHRGKKRSRTMSHSLQEWSGMGAPVTPAMAAVMLIRAKRLAAETAAVARKTGGRARRPALLSAPEPRPALRASRRLRGLQYSPQAV